MTRLETRTKESNIAANQKEIHLFRCKEIKIRQKQCHLLLSYNKSI